jgi:hypothetical protein
LLTILRKTLSVSQLRRNSFERRRLACTEDDEEQGTQGVNADENDLIVAPSTPEAPPSPIIAP